MLFKIPYIFNKLSRIAIFEIAIYLFLIFATESIFCSVVNFAYKITSMVSKGGGARRII